MDSFMQNGQINYVEVTRVLAILEALQQNNHAVNVAAQGNLNDRARDALYENEQRLDSITIIKSEKGHDKAVYGGHQFVSHFQNRTGTKQYWRCVKFEEKNGKCKARLHALVVSNICVKFLPHSDSLAHNHAFDPMAIPINNVKANIKRRALDTREKPKELLNHELQSVPLALGPSLGDSATRKMVRRVRIANQIPVVESARVEDVDIPAACQKYQDGAGREELFLLGDSGKNDSERILLFGRERHIEWSGEMKYIYMDGSFSITPAPFYQVYAILAERSARAANGGKWVFPVLYALLKSKSRDVYTKLFKMVKQLWPDFTPTSISVDFEQAAIQSLIEVFPYSKISGCLFHLVKNFKKQIGICGLSGRYQEPEFSVLARTF